ncbi:MAG: GNAT family N-acetyltransferase [Planctomycetota bacterium]|nr:GNAT family N-acetyltransferase [Planctomycetota bacterium]
MRSLSNSLAHRDGSTGERRDRRPQPLYRPIAHGEVDDALRLILATDGKIASDEQVLDFLNFALHRGMDLNQIRVAAQGGCLAWAVLPVVSPGRTMLLLSPPRVSRPLSDTVAPELIEHVVTHFAATGVHLAQVLIDPRDTSAIALYQTCGFENLAELIYLHRTIRGSNYPTLPGGTHWTFYSPQAHGAFARAIGASYAGSLDCPALNGRRGMEDVIAGHKAAGEFDPRLWHLLCAEGHDDPLGVLLLARSARSDAMELVYLGITPAARGQGLGELMMRQALAVAASSGCGLLSLAVDARNAPALKLYYRSGLSRVCTRIALLRDLREPRAAHQPSAQIG